MRLRRSAAVRAALVAVVVAIALTLAACGSSTGPRDASPVVSATVVMKDTQFQPPHIQIPVRTTVTFTNADQIPHNVKFDDGPKSDNLAFGATFQREFDSPGTFDYECTIHSGMVGRVTVVSL
jgi:plastocyanin